MRGVVQNIRSVAVESEEPRRVLCAAKNCHLVVLALTFTEEIGAEHP